MDDKAVVANAFVDEGVWTVERWSHFTNRKVRGGGGAPGCLRLHVGGVGGEGVEGFAGEAHGGPFGHGEGT